MGTKLDANQVIKDVYDSSTNSLKTIPGSSTSFSIELDADDGDSVQSQGRLFESSQTGVDNSYSDVVIDAFDVTGASVINIFSKTQSNITDVKQLTLQISPVDSGDFWIATTLTLTPDTTSPNTKMGSVLSNLVAKRARVVTNGAITTGTYDLYAIARG